MLTFNVCESCGAVFFTLYAKHAAKRCQCGGEIVGTAEAERRQYPLIAYEENKQLTQKELPNG